MVAALFDESWEGEVPLVAARVDSQCMKFQAWMVAGKDLEADSCKLSTEMVVFIFDPGGYNWFLGLSFFPADVR